MNFLKRYWTKCKAWLEAQPAAPSYPLTYEEWDAIVQWEEEREQEAAIARCLAQELADLGLRSQD